MLKSIGFQIPIELQKSGYIGSISYFNRSVNIKGKKFSKVFKENVVKNSARDTLGNTLTEAQQSNFAESKAQGENEESRLKALNSSEDIKFSDRDFSYEAITSKPDMKVIAVNNQIPNNRADIVHIAKKNAASIGKRNKDGSVSVYVDDVDKDILLGTDGLKHGLRRRTTSQENANFIVTLKAGEIIKNSIKINEMLPTKENASKSYVLLGAAQSNDGDIYIVRSIVNQFNNELSSMDVLYAINTKKEMAVTESPRFAERPLSDTISTISISDLLDYVNKYFPDVLPEDVLRHYQYTQRPKGDLGENILYSDRENVSVYDLMGENKRLIKENEKFKADVERLKERLKIERQVTHGNYFNENQLNAVAGHLRKISNSNYSKPELVKQLNVAFYYHAKNP